MDIMHSDYHITVDLGEKGGDSMTVHEVTEHTLDGTLTVNKASLAFHTERLKA